MIVTLFYDTIFLIGFILLLALAIITGVFNTMGRPDAARYTLIASAVTLVLLIGYGAYMLLS